MLLSPGAIRALWLGVLTTPLDRADDVLPATALSAVVSVLPLKRGCE